MSNKRGFTLIEILITVAIVSTVALLGIPNLKKFNEGQAFQAQVSELTRTIKRVQSNSQSGIVCGDNKRSSEWAVTFLSASQYQISPTCPDSTSATPTETKDLPTGTTLSIKSGTTTCTTPTTSSPTTITFTNQDRSLKFVSPGCPNPARLDIDFRGPKNESARVYVDLGGAIGQCELDSAGVCK